MDTKTSLSGIISAIRKPLIFASKDDFARLNTVKGIEPLMQRLSADAITLDGSGVVKTAFVRLNGIFAGFDGDGDTVKREKIKEALSILSSITGDDAVTPPEMALSAAPLPTHAEALRSLAALKTPLQFVKGIGPKLAERLSGKGLATVEDMLYFLPIRYEDRTRLKKIKELRPGEPESVIAKVLAFGEARYGRRKVYEVAVGDATGILKLKWFHYKLSYMTGRYKNGDVISAFGTVSTYGAQKEMIHPDIEKLDSDEAASGVAVSGGNGGGVAQGIIPVYSQVEGFHQKTMRKIIHGVVDAYAASAVTGAPPDVRRRLHAMDISSAFREAHMPVGEAASTPARMNARKSLAFDELFLLELGLALKRANLKKEPGISFKMTSGKPELAPRLRALLPFKLTGAQERVVAEVNADMDDIHPMNRLIQGDVGSGKTIVAFIAALKAIEAGYQASLMAPTEILAEQHYLGMHGYAEKLGIRVSLITGSMKKSERTIALRGVMDGESDLIIGTHALIQKGVEFRKLGLVIIDEQHRFGVVQRAALKKKGGVAGADRPSPDIMIMTATPIPRTLGMTVFGDLDVSVIDEMPPGRTPVKTRIIREKDRLKAYGQITSEVSSGHQAYIVYPLVEESDELPLRDATRMKEHLEKDVFPQFKVALLHGRMKSAEKESVMSAFKGGSISILVSTTVIEVGVDVPNATVMLIEHADRFGLAQLHQLRGRVGRGRARSACILLAEWTQSEDTYRRLKVMEETNDGFKIAEEDLKIRGPGDFIGTRQAGMPDFKTTETLSDLSLLKAARAEAFGYLEKNPNLTGSEAAVVKEVLRARWAGRLELVETG